MALIWPIRLRADVPLRNCTLTLTPAMLCLCPAGNRKVRARSVGCGISLGLDLDTRDPWSTGEIQDSASRVRMTLSIRRVTVT